MTDEASDSERTSRAAKPVDPMLRIMGERLRTVREGKGRGLVETARTAGMSKGFLWRTEAGQQNLSIRTLARIALALDATMSELLQDVPALAVGTGELDGEDGKAAGEDAG